MENSDNKYTPDNSHKQFLSEAKQQTDGIWISRIKEMTTIRVLTDTILGCGYDVATVNHDNYGYPTVFTKDNKTLACRLVDLVEDADIVITDNHPLKPTGGKRISVLPEFWGQWQFVPEYIDRPATIGYNCFMYRLRGDRDRIFELLTKRNILNYGLVSYLDRDYDTVNSHGTLEQCIIDTNISLILETYTRDETVVFSEKIFRALQIPRPWLLYCSPHSIELLQAHGFDVLDDYVDTDYDIITNHWQRMDAIVDQLETFIDRQYTPSDYKRFKQAAKHNQQLLASLLHSWPEKLKTVMSCLTP
jgi:hypothetical protein